VLSVEIDNRPPAPPGQGLSANHRVVSPGYFRTRGIPLRRGRTFTAQDTGTGQMVAVIDEAFARRHFPEDDPIGRGLDIGNGTDGFYRIVGVVGDVRQSGLAADPSPTMYVPYKQDVFSAMWMVVRTDGEPAALAPSVRETVRSIDGMLPAYSITPMATVLEDSVAEQRFSMLLLTVFAGVALTLAAIGLYGVVAYTVSQRTREIGLRMAIGASSASLLRLVVGGGMKLALLGVLIGLGSAVALSTYIESMLFEIPSSDSASYAATAGLLLAIAALACYIPARRALRVDPLVALQAE
jgi:putative ABC transport system permease protein